MRPAFGSGEDWNPCKVLAHRWPDVLRPAFGSGEDWNEQGRAHHVGAFGLRPAFGSGEDWNELYSRVTLDVRFVAPGLRVGRGLELFRDRAGRLWRVRCARPSGRARIGTRPTAPATRGPRVAPGLRVGRGLEPSAEGLALPGPTLRPAFGSGEDWNRLRASRQSRGEMVAPGLRVGRGLEPHPNSSR